MNVRLWRKHELLQKTYIQLIINTVENITSCQLKLLVALLNVYPHYTKLKYFLIGGVRARKFLEDLWAFTAILWIGQLSSAFKKF